MLKILQVSAQLKTNTVSIRVVSNNLVKYIKHVVIYYFVRWELRGLQRGHEYDRRTNGPTTGKPKEVFHMAGTVYFDYWMLRWEDIKVTVF